MGQGATRDKRSRAERQHSKEEHLKRSSGRKQDTNPDVKIRSCKIEGKNTSKAFWMKTGKHQPDIKEDSERLQDSINYEPPESSDDEVEATTLLDVGRFSEKVGLEGSYPNMLRLEYAKRFRKSDKSTTFFEVFFSKLISLDPRVALPESYSLFTTVTWSMRDFLYVLYVSCDLLLLQKVTNYLSMCRLAVPLLLPGIQSQQCKSISVGLSKIMRSWNYQEEDSFTVEHLIALKAMFSVGIVRIGEIPVSKSKLINTIFGRAQGNDYHFHFLSNEEDPFPVMLSKGLIEVNWYIPIEKRKEEIIQSMTAFFNLRGNAEDFKVQFRMLMKVTNVLLVLTDNTERTRTHIKEILKDDLMFLDEKILIVCLTKCSQGLQCTFQKKGIATKKVPLPLDYCLPLSIELCKLIYMESTKFDVKSLQSINNFHFENLDIEKDEKEPNCKEGKERAEQIFDLETRKMKINEFKDTHLLLQSGKSDKMSPKMEQVSQSLMEIITHSNHSPLIYFISYIKQHLHSILHNSLCSIYCEIKKLEQEELSKHENVFSREDDWRSLIINAARETMGIEHLLRELVLANVKSEDQLVELEKLAQVASVMLLNGFPLEIFDGENSRVEFKWLAAIFQSHTELSEGRIFVISVIGMQSSGKSTLLNSLFGLEFGACSGRCTRGLFMQIVKLEESFAKEVQFDYILVIDTEGLMSPVTRESQNNTTDAKIVTLAMCISDLTLLNVFGEMMDPHMTRMIQSAVHSLIRMKRKGVPFHFRLIQQGISDATTVQNNRAGRYSIVQTLDEITKAAAMYENVQGYRKFSDLFNFSTFEDISCIPCLRLGHSSPPNYTYSTAIQQLRQEICNLFSRSKGQRKQSFSNFLSNLKTVYYWLESAQIVTDFSNIMQSMEYLELRLNYNKLISDMRQRNLMFHLNELTEQRDEEFSETCHVLETKTLIHDYIDQFRFEHTDDLEAVRSYKRHLKTNFDNIASHFNLTGQLAETVHLSEANEIITSQFGKKWSNEVKLEALRFVLEYFIPQNEVYRQRKNNSKSIAKCLYKAYEDYYARNFGRICHAILSDIIKQSPGMVYLGNLNKLNISSSRQIELKNLATASAKKIKGNWQFLNSTLAVTTYLREALLEIMGSSTVNVNGVEATFVMSNLCSELFCELGKRKVEIRSIFEQARLRYASLDTMDKAAAVAFYDCILTKCVSNLLAMLNSEIVKEMRKNTALIDREYLIASIFFDIGQRDSFSDMLAFMKVPYLFAEHWINKHIANWYKTHEIKVKIKARLKDHTKSLISILESMQHDLRYAFSWNTLCDTFLAKCPKQFGFRDIKFTVSDCQYKLKFKKFRAHFLHLLETKFSSDVELELNLPKENDYYKIVEFLSNMPKYPASQILEHLGNCWERCPYCGALCHIQESNHQKHFARMHYPIALNGFLERCDEGLFISTSVCRYLPASPQQIIGGLASNKDCPTLRYYDEWAADSSNTLSNYWKRMLAYFSTELHAKYNVQNTSFPKEWDKIKKEKAQIELAKTYEAYFLL